MPRKAPIRPEDVYEIVSPSTVRLSPRGDQLIAAVTQVDREKLKNLTHLWLCRPDGTPAAAPGGRPDPPRAPSPRGGGPRPAAEEAGPAAVRQFTFGKSSEQNPRWSPDGRTIAFTSNRTGKSELWLIPADGGEARQLTKLGGNVGDFGWSPDGRRIVFQFTPQDPEAKEREEKKKRGEPGTDAPRVREVRRIFYKLDGAGYLPSGRVHLWTVDVAGGRTRQLTSDDRYDEHEPKFSPDGRWIYFVSNRSADPDLMFRRFDIWRMPRSGGPVTKIRSFDGPAESISPSPDGEWIAFLGSPDADAPSHLRHQKLWLIPSRGGRPVCLTEALDRHVGNATISDTSGLAGDPPAIWSPDSQWLYFTVTNAGNSEIWRVGRRERRPEPVVNEPGMVIDFAVDFARGRILVSWNDLQNPGEIRSFPLPAERSSGRRAARGAARRGEPARGPEPSAAPGRFGPVTLSSFNTGWLSRREVAHPQEFWFTGKGNHRLQGWILNPPRLPARRLPGILYIHGGPATQYGRAFFHEFQVLAANGYAVFYSNPRGGSGYSERHMNAILSRWGTIDYEDLMAFTDAALRRARHVDPRRLAVAGGSYGGFMTNWIIGHTSRFACAVTSRSISNFMSFLGSSDFGYAWPREFGNVGPWENPRHYLRMSPLAYLANIRTPTLIEHQEEDHRCPIEQAEQLWAALKAKGVPAEFLRYPGEPHGMSRSGRPDRRIDRLERILAWIGRWTRGRRGGQAARPRSRRTIRASRAGKAARSRSTARGRRTK